MQIKYKHYSLDLYCGGRGLIQGLFKDASEPDYKTYGFQLLLWGIMLTIDTEIKTTKEEI